MGSYSMRRMKDVKPTKSAMNWLLGLLFIGFFVGCSESESGQTALVAIYDNAVIYTCEEDLPVAQAMVVGDDKIVYVGTHEGAAKYKNEKAQVIDLQGKTILPGMIESHAHPGMVAVLNNAGAWTLSWDVDKEQILSEVRAYLKENPQATHIMAMGFNPSALGLPQGETPTSADLDAISTEIPIFLYDDSFHSSWVNSKVLELGGIDEHTPDPVPGISYYVRHPQTNKPTGYMYEGTSHSLVEKMPFFALESVAAELIEFLSYYSQLGFTAIFDAGTLCTSEYDAVANVEAFGALNLYYQKVHPLNYHLTPAENIKKLQQLDSKYTKGNLYCNIYKLYEDGTIEASNASLIEPYSDSGAMAEPFLTEAQTYEHVAAALTAGYAVHCHAIGDRAQKNILDAYVATKDINPHLTRTVAHNEVFEPQGVEKFKLLKDHTFCQSTPSWATVASAAGTMSRLGEERFNNYMYLWGQVIDEGVNVTFGSDYPANLAEDINPFRQMYYAVMRRQTPNDYYPPKEAGVSMEQALKAYTINGAKQMGFSRFTGSLKAGKYADFIVVDRDILRVDPQQVIDTKVEQVYFQGRKVILTP